MTVSAATRMESYMKLIVWQKLLMQWKMITRVEFKITEILNFILFLFSSQIAVVEESVGAWWGWRRVWSLSHYDILWIAAFVVSVSDLSELQLFRLKWIATKFKYASSGCIQFIFVIIWDRLLIVFIRNSDDFWRVQWAEAQSLFGDWTFCLTCNSLCNCDADRISWGFWWWWHGLGAERGEPDKLE